MEKILLIQPPMDLRKQLGKFEKIDVSTPPLGLAYIASVVEKCGCDVSVFDAFALDSGIDEVKRILKKNSPDLVGISCLTPTSSTSHLIAKLVKLWNKECTVVMGGIHPTIMIHESLQNGNVDIVVRGEGEHTMRELVKYIKRGYSLKKIHGISYRKNGKIVHTPERPFIEDLDNLPFPAWHLFPLAKYHPPPHWTIKLPALPLLSSRGCPYSCTFCSLITQGKRHRVRSPKNVVDEIEFDVSEYGTKEIMFWDATFPLNKKIGEKICKEIIKRGLHKEIVWLSEARVDRVDKDLLTLMKKSGCRRVAYGIESAVQRILNNVKKGFTIEQAETAVRLTRKIGLETIGYFMLGLPGETEQTALATIEFAKRIDPDFSKFNLTVPYPGSQLFNEAVKGGALNSRNWDDFSSLSGYSDYEPVYVPKNMTAEKLKKIQRDAMRKFYLRPRKMLRYICKMRSIQDVKTYLLVARSIVS